LIILLTSIVTTSESGFNSDFSLGSNVLFCEKNKIVSSTTLKFFIGNGIVMLSVVFTNTWVVFTNDELSTFVHFRFE